MRPTWGVWLEDTFYCGGERTRWVRNLSTNPEIVVHREDAEAVVILEGWAERIDDETGNGTLVERIDSAYAEKYDIRPGTPFFAVRPDAVFAWENYPTTRLAGNSRTTAIPPTDRPDAVSITSRRHRVLEGRRPDGGSRRDR